MLAKLEKENAELKEGGVKLDKELEDGKKVIGTLLKNVFSMA